MPGANELVAERIISRLQLNVRAKVSDATQDEFVHAALAAKANSPVARLFRAMISMTAHLEAE